MCPICTTLALIGTVTATGGVIALVAKTLRAKRYFHGTHIKEGKIIVTRNTLTKIKTKTAPSTDGVAFIDGDEDIACERAAMFASVSPLGIVAMGTFPLSLVAWGQISRRRFDDSLTPRPKRDPTHAARELESPKQIAVNVRTDSFETAKPGGRTHPLCTV